MIGMIKKDLLMIKNNYRILLVTLALFIFYSIQFDMDMSFFLPFMGLMSCISTINYDDFNNFHTYASSLPQGKAGVVKSKYITTISVILILSIFSILINIIIGKTDGEFLINESISSIIGILFAMIFMMSVLFPVLFKFGAEKRRIAMTLIILGILGSVMLFTKVVKLEISENLITFLDSYFPIIFILISVIMLICSYFISKRIYLKREF